MKKIISILKNMYFSGEGRQSPQIYTSWEFIKFVLISYVELNHALYSINYGTWHAVVLSRLNHSKTKVIIITTLWLQIKTLEYSYCHEKLLNAYNKLLIISHWTYKLGMLLLVW